MTIDHDIQRKCIEVAKEAARYTYGVGAVVHQNGQVIFTAPNAVYEDGFMRDSSAHAEIQAIRKQEEGIKKGEYPPFNQTSLATSLCPCLMCTGALLKLAGSDTSSGYKDVHFIAQNDVINLPVQQYLLPPASRAVAAKLFRQCTQPDDGMLVSEAVTTFQKSRDSLMQSKSRNAAMTHTNQPASTANGLLLTNNIMNQAVTEELIKIAKDSYHNGNDFDAAILFDSQGHELFRSGSRSGASILETPIMNIINDFETWSFHARKRGEAPLEFTSCTIVSLKEPQLMEAGRIGFAAGKHKLGKSSVQYLLPDDALGIKSSGLSRKVTTLDASFGIHEAISRSPSMSLVRLAEAAQTTPVHLS